MEALVPRLALLRHGGKIEPLTFYSQERVVAPDPAPRYTLVFPFRSIQDSISCQNCTLYSEIRHFVQ